MTVEEAGKVLRYRSPHKRQEWTARLGMIIFLASWAMMFAALFFVYAGARSKALVWPPIEFPELPLMVPALNTVVVALSSALLHLGLRRVAAGQARFLAWSLVGVAVLGTLFLMSQLYVWDQMHTLGLTPGSGMYGSAFFGLTWVHAGHVLVGLIALAVLTARAFLGHYTAARHLMVRLWAMYWHFVGVVWAILFFTVYVL